jgi:hypothetical protein
MSLKNPRHDGRQTGFVGVRVRTRRRPRLNGRTNRSPTCRRLAPDFALFPSGYRVVDVPQVHPPPKTAKSAAAGRVSLSPRHVGGRALRAAAIADDLTEVTARGEPRRNGPTESPTKPRRKSASAHRPGMPTDEPRRTRRDTMERNRFRDRAGGPLVCPHQSPLPRGLAPKPFAAGAGDNALQRPG